MEFTLYSVLWLQKDLILQYFRRQGSYEIYMNRFLKLLKYILLS